VNVRDAAIITLTASIAGQAGEISGLRMGDIEISEMGVSVRRPSGLLSFAPRSSQVLLDPVAALHRWLTRLGERHIEDHLFVRPRRPSRWRNASNFPSFKAASAMQPGRARQPWVTFHSLRINSVGGRTDMGFEVHKIAEQGMWEPAPITVRYAASPSKELSLRESARSLGSFLAKNRTLTERGPFRHTRHAESGRNGQESAGRPHEDHY
jgi:hypothetical protein